MKSPYVQLLTDLQQHTGVHLGLDHVRQLLTRVGNPHRKMQHVHVAGTNGKGSVCWKVATGLQRAGHRVGLFTSPHIASFRERIQVQGLLCSEELLVDVGRQVLDAAEGTATYFELITVMGFLAFARMHVETAVIEVGLGGRLDATNVIDPILTVITSIGLDHTELLGSDLNQIAAEKAGIIKPRVPLVVGADAYLDPIIKRADELHLVASMPGDFDSYNRAIAQRCLELLGVPSDSAALDVRPPCRMQRIGCVTLDVAHNPDGLRALRRSIPIPDHIIVGLSASKDLDGCFHELAAWGRPVHLLAPPHPRLASLALLEEAARRAGIVPVSRHAHAAAALQQLTGSSVVCCGSFFIMADLREALGVPQIRDPEETSAVETLVVH